ncbi:hypothetical protein C0989_000274 [Termitomyces sp. Mn162]|nr:hypothetical protein C0989_000274 [Termitomyces sp. Mn162]
MRSLKRGGGGGKGGRGRSAGATDIVSAPNRATMEVSCSVRIVSGTMMSAEVRMRNVTSMCRNTAAGELAQSMEIALPVRMDRGEGGVDV